RLEDHQLRLFSDRLIVQSPGGTERELPLSAIEKIRAHGVVGSGFLQARMGDAWVDLVRYSNGHAARFAKLADRLERFREEGLAALASELEPDERHCPGCGLALGFSGDVCPRCIDRGAVLVRVWDMLRPYRVPAAVLCLLILLGVIVDLAPPKLQQYLVD